MPSILIADDHPLFRAALKQVAADAVGDMTMHEADSLDAVLATLEKQPEMDLILLDLHMPGNHGLTGLAAIRAQYPAAERLRAPPDSSDPRQQLLRLRQQRTCSGPAGARLTTLLTSPWSRMRVPSMRRQRSKRSVTRVPALSIRWSGWS